MMATIRHVTSSSGLRKFQADGFECTYNVALRRVRAAGVAVEKQYYKSCLSVFLCVCVFVAFGIHHAMRMRHIFICGLPHSPVFFHFFS